MSPDNPFSIGSSTGDRQRRTPFNTLRRLAGGRDEPDEPAASHCELCSETIHPIRHRHLLNMSNRQVACACDACALLFDDTRASRFSTVEYKLVPRDVKALSDFTMTDVQWNTLGLPINLAFFMRRTSDGDSSDEVLALYPSPAGGTESRVPLEAWQVIVTENPVLEQMKPDVEALLVNRMDDAGAYYLAPIDTCYELVGLIRLHWRGFSGGEKVWNEIESFFDRL